MDASGPVKELAMRLILLAGVALVAVGCASQPKPCTAEWVEWKKNQVFDRFINRNHDAIATVIEQGSKLAEKSDGKGGVSQALEAASTVVVTAKLVGNFVETAAPEIRDAVGKCGGSAKTARLFADMLRRDGASEKTARAIENLGLMLED
jgi:hypothetical protein